MTLTDAGPLVALIDADEPDHEALWKLLLSGRLDLADATLVAVAEERGDRRVFTLDSDFQVYRLHGRQRFEIVPG